MASACDVIAAFEKFELNLIEKEWSDEIWSSDFTLCPDDLPEEFSDKFSPLNYEDIDHVIEDADKIINLWLTKSIDESSKQCCSDESGNDVNSSSSNPSWMSLQDVKYKQLLALLYYYVSKGQLNNQDNNAVNTCVKSTNFYFTLLLIPGSDVFKIFHITLFEKCLETLSLHKYLEIATGRKIKKIRSQKKNEDMSSDDEFLEMDETLTLSQQLTVVKQLNFLMMTFEQFVKKFSFKNYPEALTMSLSILSDLTRLERNSTLHEFSSNNTITSFVPLSRNAFVTMKNLCSPFHGRMSEIIRLVLFHLVPNLTSVGGLAYPEMSKFTPKELANIRNIATSFIIENIIPLGEDAQMGLKILIQQLCYNMIDRADYRSKATDMVLTILCKLPKELYYNLMKWIFRMSMMEGAHHRVISLELLSKLIFMKPGTNEMSKLVDMQHQLLDSQFQISNATGNAVTTSTDLHQKTENTTNFSQEPIISFSQPVNYVPLEFRRIMFAIIIDRIRDEAAIVRTRALSILADIISSKTSVALQLILRDLFVQPYVELTSIYLRNFEEENDFLKWKTFIGLLEKAHNSETSKQMFPGARVIVIKVFEKCLDERVNVRKAALQVISTLFKFCPKWMTTEALTLFGNHCRDPALSIRKDMINSVTELLLFFPNQESIIELWVDEVVPLIMDREIKVQEQALQIFTNLILSKLKAFKDIDSNLDELPWKLIDKIAKQGKRSFFKAACALWSESGSFNQSLIEILKSHIDTTNDGPAWMFLACISEYFDIMNPEFVLEYYLKVISKEIGDKNKLYFALLTLSKSWQKLPKEKIGELQIEMYNKLKKFAVSPIFVTLTVETVAEITVFIAEEKLSGKKEIAKWGIEMIQDCESHLENCLKLPLVNENCPHCINILGLLGALVGICPYKIGNSTYSLLFNYLMDSCNKGGSVFQRKKCAIAVITLSKMALYNDYFARNLVAGLAQLLSQSSDPVVLNNIMVAIADIGESYASLIEPIIPFLCVWLKSKHESLKEITLVLLIELLQEDYLKARDILVFHLLTMINEKNPWLVNIVKYYFMNSLLARNPYKMYQLLLPGLFHFNNYTSHPDYPRLDMTETEWQAFDLSGSENHINRLNIFKFMLSNVPYMVKMKCLHFICTVVLNGVADGIINIKGKNGEQLLFDALCILVMPEIKIEYKDLVKGKNEDGEDDEEQKQMPLCKLVKQMFTAVQKKEIIETIIPICCKLKKKLLLDNKKLLPYLYRFIRELLRDYKSEINEIFKEDKQFGIEILHELDAVNNINENEEDEVNLNQQYFVGPDPLRKSANLNAENCGETHQTSQTLLNENDNRKSTENSVREAVTVNSTETFLNQDHNPIPNAVENTQSHSLNNLSNNSNLDVPINESEKISEKVDKSESKSLSSNLITSKQSLKLSLKSSIKDDRKNIKLQSFEFSSCQKKDLKRSQQEDNQMKKAVGKIKIPPPLKKNLKSKKSLYNSKNLSVPSPRTPILGENDKKELLTSTPLIMVGNPNFDMELSSVVNESN